MNSETGTAVSTRTPARSSTAYSATALSSRTPGGRSTAFATGWLIPTPSRRSTAPEAENRALAAYQHRGHGFDDAREQARHRIDTPFTALRRREPEQIRPGVGLDGWRWRHGNDSRPGGRRVGAAAPRPGAAGRCHSGDRGGRGLRPGTDPARRSLSRPGPGGLQDRRERDASLPGGPRPGRAAADD